MGRYLISNRTIKQPVALHLLQILSVKLFAAQLQCSIGRSVGQMLNRRLGENFLCGHIYNLLYTLLKNFVVILNLDQSFTLIFCCLSHIIIRVFTESCASHS
jgi:hypothetical protein